MTLLHRLLTAIRRARLRAAEQDLAWLEAHAPREIERRRRVARVLRERIRRAHQPPSAEAILARANAALKRGLLHGGRM